MGNHCIECEYCFEDTRGLSGVKGCNSQEDADRCIEYKEAHPVLNHAKESGDITWTRLKPANDNHVTLDWPRVVGLQGYGGSGKSEVRKVLERRGYVARHIKMTLAKMTVTMLIDSGVATEREEIERYMNGDLKRTPIPELGGKSATEIQQFLGTAFGRDFIDPDIWLNIWCRWADGQLSNGGRVVQESVRFANEVDAVRVRGGIILEVRRPNVGPVNGHVSETLPTSPDAVIQNDGSLADLESRVVTALELAA